MKIGDKYYCKKDLFRHTMSNQNHIQMLFRQNVIYSIERLTEIKYKKNTYPNTLLDDIIVHFCGDDGKLYYFSINEASLNLYDYFENVKEVRIKKLNKIGSV